MMGIDWEVMLDNDVRFFNNCVNGYIARREVYINDLQLLIKPLAAKINQSLFNSREFNKPLKPIKLKDGSSEESREEKVLKTLMEKGII